MGYYDLRLPEVREKQATMAREAGVEGFCYWHYWFGNGRRLLERPFNEVLASGEPDFPFCLAWANTAWEDKLFNKDGSKKVLIEQTYPGEDDYIHHFHTLLPAFRDKRYIRVDDKPLFMVYSYKEIPDVPFFIRLWNRLARENGLKGIHFVAHTYDEHDMEPLRDMGFDGVNIVRLFHFFKKDFSLVQKCYMKVMRLVFGKGRIVPYAKASKYFSDEKDSLDYCYPTIIPNWDHSPRSGRSTHILVNSTPALFFNHVKTTLKTVENREHQHQLIFLKSWNEWAEGNYMEPDLKYGKGYLNALKKALDGDKEYE
ncbi:MAG: glycoside hydrolase family 99-like domain-containing protein [Dysgonamonadaceae bacterium]|nr:glycoside hydrolase family 99-like domain-containing protein [Dysgonamonadaceae bacterium]